jgi:hypothetical protein
MMLAVYWTALLLCTAGSLLFCLVARGGRRRLELSPRLILVLAYAMYASALPASRLLLGTTGDAVVDTAYLVPNLLGAVGILAGLVPMRAHDFPTRAQLLPSEVESPLRPLLVVGAVMTGISWQVYVLLMQVRGNIAGLLSPYATGGEGYNPPGLLGSLVVITSNIAIATIVLAFPALRRGGWLRWFVIAATAVLAGLFAVRGHRNLLGMLVLPLLTLHMFAKELPLRRLLMALAGGYVFLYGVGIVRNFGVAKAANAVAQVDVSRAFDPLSGEFGTSYNVFRVWQRLPVRRTPQLGATYTRDVVLNLVPRQLWPDRPATPAVSLSMEFYRTRNLRLGLGYAPVVEAIANFGVLGVFPVFACFAAFVRWAERRAQSGAMVPLLAYGFLTPAMVNFNRIDMATNVKMFLVSTLIASVLRHVLYRGDLLARVPTRRSAIVPLPARG